MEGEVTDASPPTTASVSEEALREVASNRNDDEIADPERVDQVISEASIKSLTNALQGEHVSEVLYMLQEDDLWMPRVMARRVENLEEDRDVRVRLIRILLIIGTKIPSVFTMLMLRDSLTTWVYNDIQTEGDDDLLFLALHMLSKICGLPHLPAPIKEKLGYNLVQFLIELTLKYNGHPDDTPVRDAALLALLQVNTKFETTDLKENRVLNKLVSMKEAQGDLGQLFISVLNRMDNPEAIQPDVKVLSDIFQNPVSSKNFFFRTDFDVLVEVLIRNLGDLSDGEERRGQMEVLANLVEFGDYHNSMHRKSDLVALLQALADYDGDPVLASKAQHVLKACPYLIQ